ncbi:SLC13 family permease [Zobellia nedashkovskayae]
MAFGSNTGGLLTLTGTPPNIIVSNVLTENGIPSFSFFEFALVGLPLLLIVILYFKFIGYRLLPNHETEDKPVNIDSEVHKWIKNYSIGDNMYRLRIRSMSELIGTEIGSWDFEKKYNVSVMRLRRRHPSVLKGTPPYVEFPEPNTQMRYHDIITVKGTAKDVDRIILEFKLGLIPKEFKSSEVKRELINQEVGMVEMIVTPTSFFVGKTLPMGKYLNKWSIQLLGASRDGKPIGDKNVTIKAGDAFVIRGSWENIEALNNVYENLVVSGSPEAMAKDVDVLTPRPISHWVL